MPRLTSSIDELNTADKEQILAWLEAYPTRTVVEMIAKTPPDGFGVRTHVTTLRRFFARHEAEAEANELEIAKLFESNGASTPLESATEALLRKWAFKIATNPHRSTGAFKALSSWLHRTKEQKHREMQLKINSERLALEREKFEFNAARQALIHHERLGKILDEPDSNQEEKIRAAREQLFGKSIPGGDFPGVDPIGESELSDEESN
jgi:hypothetical protein